MKLKKVKIRIAILLTVYFGENYDHCENKNRQTVTTHQDTSAEKQNLVPKPKKENKEKVILDIKGPHKNVAHKMWT